MIEHTKHHKEKEKTEGGRGVETLFRVTFSNQIHLIQIADNKANSIITINTLVITILIGLSGYGSISEKVNIRSYNILLPIILLMMTCLVSIIFALLATQPRIIKTKNKKIETSSNGSLLFFGTIPDRTLENYLADMDTLTHSPALLYHAMETEIYNQSKVLNRKYKLLHISFLVFMYGFIVSVLTFISILIFHF